MVNSPISPAMPGAYRFSTSSRERIYTPDSAFFTNSDSPVLDRTTATAAPLPSSSLDHNDDDLHSELAYLERLRRDVKNNLSIRPLSTAGSSTSQQDLPSKRRSIQLDLPPLSATSTIFTYRTAPSSPSGSVYSPGVYSPLASTQSQYPSLGGQLSQTASPADARGSGLPLHHSSPLQHISADDLATLLTQNPSSTPLILDTRPAAQFQQYRFRHSVNLAIPSLILKRCRRPGSGFAAMANLKTFITVDEARLAWETLMDPAPTSFPHWNGKIEHLRCVLVLNDLLYSPTQAILWSPMRTWWSPPKSSRRRSMHLSQVLPSLGHSYLLLSPSRVARCTSCAVE